jgi:hypothetical protein
MAMVRRQQKWRDEGSRAAWVHGGRPARLEVALLPLLLKNKQRHAERQRATTVAMRNKLWRRTNFSENSLSSTALAVDDL